MMPITAAANNTIGIGVSSRWSRLVVTLTLALTRHNACNRHDVFVWQNRITMWIRIKFLEGHNNGDCVGSY